MKNFVYNSPTKIIFGKDQINALESELLERSVTSILLVYGKTSIKKNGIYDKVIEVTSKLGINLVEESGVRPNPEISSVRSGVQKCKDHNVDFILATGGGSVIDCAKAIAFGVNFEGDIWDIYLRKADATNAIALGVVITLAATGTETNGNTVLSNDETSEKRSVAYPFIIPQFAIIDPSYTLTVNRHHTIAGSIDIIMHILEQYFSNTMNTETSDYMSIGVIRSVIENTNKLLAGGDSYDVRCNLSWASTIGLNWILGVDKVGDWATHRLSYALTKEYDTTHGYALALLFTSWCRVALKYNEETMVRRLNLLGNQLFDGVQNEDVLDMLDDLFVSWGANVRINEEMELSDSDLEALADNALGLGNVGTVITIDKEKAMEIFRLSNS